MGWFGIEHNHDSNDRRLAAFAATPLDVDGERAVVELCGEWLAAAHERLSLSDIRLKKLIHNKESNTPLRSSASLTKAHLSSIVLAVYRLRVAALRSGMSMLSFFNPNHDAGASASTTASTTTTAKNDNDDFDRRARTRHTNNDDDDDVSFGDGDDDEDCAVPHSGSSATTSSDEAIARARVGALTPLFARLDELTRPLPREASDRLNILHLFLDALFVQVRYFFF